MSCFGHSKSKYPWCFVHVFKNTQELQKWIDKHHAQIPYNRRLNQTPYTYTSKTILEHSTAQTTLSPMAFEWQISEQACAVFCFANA